MNSSPSVRHPFPCAPAHAAAPPRVRRSQAILSKAGWALLLVALFPTALVSHGQVDMTLSATHRKFLRYEPVELKLHLRNYSGNTLVFGGAGAEARGTLRFLVESEHSLVVPVRDRKANPVADLILEPMRTKELTITLNRLFDMQAEGPYTVTAQLGHRRLSHDYQSNTITVEIQDGTVVQSRRVGLPTRDETRVIDSLTVSLLLFHQGAGALYCLRVEDEDLVYATLRLGDAVITTPPTLDADAESAVHILFQTRPRLFQYAVFSLAHKDVKLRQQKFFVSDRSIPRLVRQGEILRVVGGRPAVEGTDFRMVPEGE